MRTTDVLSSERIEEEGARLLRVRADEIDTVTPTHCAPPGDDSPPLPGDLAVVDDDGDHAVGYTDPTNAGVALPGEKRFVARGTDRVVVGVIYMRRDGTYEIGLDPSDFAARASRTDAEIERLSNEIAALSAAFTSHTHLYAPGPSPPAPTAPPASPAPATGTPQPVGSETVRIQP